MLFNLPKKIHIPKHHYRNQHQTGQSEPDTRKKNWVGILQPNLGSGKCRSPKNTGYYGFRTDP